MRSLCKWLVLLAVILMPLGMGMSPAAASPVEAGPVTMHCPDMQSEAPAAHHDGDAPGVAQCTMACTAALPTPAMAAMGKVLRTRTPRPSSPAHDLSGVEPEIATPPPRGA